MAKQCFPEFYSERPGQGKPLSEEELYGILSEEIEREYNIKRTLEEKNNLEANKKIVLSVRPEVEKILKILTQINEKANNEVKSNLDREMTDLSTTVQREKNQTIVETKRVADQTAQRKQPQSAVETKRVADQTREMAPSLKPLFHQFSKPEPVLKQKDKVKKPQKEERIKSQIQTSFNAHVERIKKAAAKKQQNKHEKTKPSKAALKPSTSNKGKKPKG